METPKLIEPGVSYFFNKTLIACHETKQKYNNLVVNIVLFFLFLFFLFVVLNYRKHNKTTNEDKIIKERKKKEYIINKLSIFNHNKQKERHEFITNFPPRK
jgi:hypothetical protein